MGTILFSHEDRGSAIIEAALLLPILMIVIAGLIDLSNSLHYKRTVSTATRHGARVGGALSHDFSSLCTTNIPEITAETCNDLPTGTTILDKSVRSSCEYISREMQDLNQFSVSSSVETITRSGLDFRAVNISTQTVPGAFCFLCPFSGFRTRQISDTSTFILEGCS